MLARARPGVTLEQAAAELDALGAELAATWPATNAGRRFVTQYEQASRRRVVGLIGSFTLLVVSLILLIAAANVAGLPIGRSEARRQEMAVRIAVGASRARLGRQLLTEAVVLALGAAALGLLLAFWMVRLLPLLIPPATLLVLVVALAAAWMPARRAARVDPVSALRADG